MKTFKTPKGTELPILDIKGKDYLQAAPRILWMREEHPDWGIETEMVSYSEKHAVFKATIRDGAGKILAQATSMETQTGFDSFLEKAETCAVSRAAAFCGYGTLMAQELEEQGREGEGKKLAEAPNEPRHLKAVSNNPGTYVIKVGKKWLGKTLEEMGPHEASNYGKYLRDSSSESGKPLTGDWLEAANAIDVFVASRTKQ